MSFLNNLYMTNLGPLLQAVQSAQAAVAARTTEASAQYSAWIANQTPQNQWMYWIASTNLTQARAQLANAEKEVTREEIRHLLRREDARAGGQPPDAPNFHYQQENNYKTLAWNQATYAHALAAAGNADVNVWPLGGRVAEELKYFLGDGRKLPVRLWLFLLDEHRGWRFSLPTAAPSDVFSAKEWISTKLPEVR